MGIDRRLSKWVCVSHICGFETGISSGVLGLISRGSRAFACPLRRQLDVRDVIPLNDKLSNHQFNDEIAMGLQTAKKTTFKVNANVVNHPYGPRTDLLI